MRARRALATSAAAPRAGATAAALLLLAGCGGGEQPPAVVSVTVGQPGGAPPERATGFVAAGGRVVTVAHVLDGGGAVAAGGRPARVVRVDRAADLALLAPAGTPAAVPAAGGDVRVLGARGTTPASVRRRISARVRDSAGPRVYSRASLELAAELRAGDSGAPVVDGSGELLGVVFARSRRDGGTAYAVDAGAVDALLGR